MKKILVAALAAAVLATATMQPADAGILPPVGLYPAGAAGIGAVGGVLLGAALFGIFFGQDFGNHAPTKANPCNPGMQPYNGDCTAIYNIPKVAR